VRRPGLPPQSGPLGAIACVAQALRCEASLVSLARTREAGGERRGGRAPVFRVCPGSGNGSEPKCRAADRSRGSVDRVRPRCRYPQTGIGPTLISCPQSRPFGCPVPFAINHTRHQARASSRVFLLEEVFLRGMERHHPANMIDSSGAEVAARGDMRHD
jgi:hypothetical protein